MHTLTASVLFEAIAAVQSFLAPKGTDKTQWRTEAMIDITACTLATAHCHHACLDNWLCF